MRQNSLPKKADILLTWKEISAYLRIDRRTCLRWEKDEGLPIHRVGESNKSTVYALPDEIDKWLLERKTRKTQARSIFPLKLRLSHAFYIGVPVILIFIIGYLFLGKISIQSIPSDFKINNSTLIIVDNKGRELWHYDTGVENLLGENHYRDHFQTKQKSTQKEKIERLLPHLIIKDINNDDKVEVLFNVQTQDEYGSEELLCFNQEGRQLWSYKIKKEMKYETMTYSSDYRIHGFDVYDIDNNGAFEIIVISCKVEYFPTQLAVLDSEGSLLGEYWNAGRLQDFVFADLNDDEDLELIAVGQNNEHKKGCLIVFEPFHIKGGSPQREAQFICKDLERGSEKYYVLFPRTDVDLIDKIYESISTIDVLSNQRLSVVALNSRIFFEFNFKLEPLYVRSSHIFERNHERARQEGKIESELNEEYWSDLKKKFLYFDGEKWVAEPSKSKK